MSLENEAGVAGTTGAGFDASVLTGADDGLCVIGTLVSVKPVIRRSDSLPIDGMFTAEVAWANGVVRVDLRPNFSTLGMRFPLPAFDKLTLWVGRKVQIRVSATVSDRFANFLALDAKVVE